MLKEDPGSDSNTFWPLSNICSVVERDTLVIFETADLSLLPEGSHQKMCSTYTRHLLVRIYYCSFWLATSSVALSFHTPYSIRSHVVWGW
jgi:hypothetical protein